ncbi:hypothetical protein T4D_1641 [Trichinella pseudospiralis]|uniref:Uncharacterized protein n=1 Tax=Trichinella pseudospiralis TaxID=6337 RepID=A0A0V1FZ47_TRIPS|nr:hypothetical protein T4D_1641 [Trichinella pseudospiralis]
MVGMFDHKMMEGQAEGQGKNDPSVQTGDAEVSLLYGYCIFDVTCEIGPKQSLTASASSFI